MGKFEKLIEELLARPTQAEFSDVRKVLEAYGWEFRGLRGSHATFRRRGERMFTIPLVKGRHVMRIYIVQVCDMLELGEGRK